MKTNPDPPSGRHKPTAGDYAVIAVAPILVFIMISSLANFLMLIIYRGGQPARVSWIMLMFTMGVVGIARIAIEKDRMYSLGYAGVLGIASFVTLSSYVNSPIGSLFLLALIAYLADWVIRDCTLIDENADSSDRGLLDSIRRNAGQPGRSVLYLAIAALPLYGLGQFFIRNDAGTWSRAQWLLACYLFSSLALLVTTSFLGLRRYLRQRGADMPGDVSIAWLGGGTATIAIILSIAFLVPVPGKTLASLELPEFLESNDETTASQQGWGDEGANKAGENAAATGSDENPAGKDKEVGSTAPQKDAPAGDAGDGDRKDGPAGKQEGGTKDRSGDQPDSGKKDSGTKGEKGEGETSPEPKNSEPMNSEPKNSGQKNDSKNKQGSDESKPPQSDSSEPSQAKRPSGKDQPKDETQPPNQPAEPTTQSDQASTPKAQAQSAPSSMQAAADLMPTIASLIKWIILAVLIGIVGCYVYLNRQFLLNFWQNLFASDATHREESWDEFVQETQVAPRRSFASLVRPSADQRDPRKIVVATFAALDAWCHESGVSRTKGETPTEFLARIRASDAELSVPASRVIAAYNRIVYGRGNATGDDLQACEELWDLMSDHRTQSI